MTGEHRNDGSHLVTFYEDDRFLAEVVAGYLADGLEQGETALVVATPEHRAAFAASLAAGGADLDLLRAAGRYLELDAATTLASLRGADGGIDRATFTAEIGGLLRRLTADGHRLRVYGEMVSLLWAEGELDLALFLEDRWNHLLDRLALPLLCGYPMAGFDTPETTARFHDVCARHRAITTDSYRRLASDDRSDARVVLLDAGEPGGRRPDRSSGWVEDLRPRVPFTLPRGA